MKDRGVTCLITLGGDGTNRAVARGSCALPLVPISTGTNNVFPAMTEGTLAGLAAGLVATNRLMPEWVTRYSKTLAVYVDGEYRDLALVDVAFSRERFTATRAIWDLATLYEVFLTRTEPAGLGLASVGARLESVTVNDSGGLHYVMGRAKDDTDSLAADGEPPPDLPDPATATVLAPIAPGVVPAIPIARWHRLTEGVRGDGGAAAQRRGSGWGTGFYGNSGAAGGNIGAAQRPPGGAGRARPAPGRGAGAVPPLTRGRRREGRP